MKKIPMPTRWNTACLLPDRFVTILLVLFPIISKCIVNAQNNNSEVLSNLEYLPPNNVDITLRASLAIPSDFGSAYCKLRWETNSMANICKETRID